MVDAGNLAVNGMMGGDLLALIMGMMFFFIIVSIIVYVYMGFAFMAIARKARLRTPGLAWIPGIGPMIIAYQTSEMHWWPWLLFIGVLIPFIDSFALIALVVMFTIWQWKMFESIKKPGWWAILCLISPLNLIFWGIAAWSK